MNQIDLIPRCWLAAEFQKVIDGRNIVVSDPIGALAHRDFLTLWKDADPNIPILIPAKTEFAALN